MPPESTCSRPAIILRAVDLPDPDGPHQHHELPRLDPQVERVDGGHLVAGVDPARLVEADVAHLRAPFELSCEARGVSRSVNESRSRAAASAPAPSSSRAARAEPTTGGSSQTGAGRGQRRAEPCEDKLGQARRAVRRLRRTHDVVACNAPERSSGRRIDEAHDLLRVALAQLDRQRIARVGGLEHDGRQLERRRTRAASRGSQAPPPRRSQARSAPARAVRAPSPARGVVRPHGFAECREPQVGAAPPVARDQPEAGKRTSSPSGASPSALIPAPHTTATPKPASLPARARRACRCRPPTGGPIRAFRQPDGVPAPRSRGRRRRGRGRRRRLVAARGPPPRRPARADRRSARCTRQADLVRRSAGAPDEGEDLAVIAHERQVVLQLPPSSAIANRPPITAFSCVPARPRPAA